MEIGGAICGVIHRTFAYNSQYTSVKTIYKKRPPDGGLFSDLSLIFT